MPFSQLLRDAVTRELERREAVSTTLNEPETYELALEDGEGRVYTGRITGKEIAYDDRREVRVFLTEDERVLVYDGHRSRYYQLENPAEQLRGWFGNKPALYAEALEALGEKPIIDL